MDTFERPSIGLALSGSGNRTTFYIGFLEVLDEAKVPIDYIAACSGGSLVAAAYACGSLREFRDEALNLTKDQLKGFFTKRNGKGGLYSLDNVEETLQKFTKGLKFEEVRPLMGFVAVDLQNGEQVVLSMGDIARAARISCTLPGLFEPVKWGGRTLIDGGLLSFIPVDVAKQAGMDIVIGVNMRGTKHIFTQRQMTLKKVMNAIKKLFLIEEIDSAINGLLKIEKENDWEEGMGVFTVLGKSLDLAIKASQTDKQVDLTCDLMIKPEMPHPNQTNVDQFYHYYEIGRRTAKKYLPEIQRLIKAKSKLTAPL